MKKFLCLTALSIGIVSTFVQNTYAYNTLTIDNINNDIFRATLHTQYLDNSISDGRVWIKNIPTNTARLGVIGNTRSPDLMPEDTILTNNDRDITFTFNKVDFIKKSNIEINGFKELPAGATHTSRRGYSMFVDIDTGGNITFEPDFKPNMESMININNTTNETFSQGTELGASVIKTTSTNADGGIGVIDAPIFGPTLSVMQSDGRVKVLSPGSNITDLPLGVAFTKVRTPYTQAGGTFTLVRSLLGTQISRTMTIDVPTQSVTPVFTPVVPRFIKYNTQLVGSMIVRRITDRDCEDYTNSPSKFTTATSQYTYMAVGAGGSPRYPLSPTRYNLSCTPGVNTITATLSIQDLPSGTYTIVTNGSALATNRDGTVVTRTTLNATAFDLFTNQTKVNVSAPFTYTSRFAVATQTPILRDQTVPEPQIRIQDPVSPITTTTETKQEVQETPVQPTYTPRKSYTPVQSFLDDL